MNAQCSCASSKTMPPLSRHVEQHQPPPPPLSLPLPQRMGPPSSLRGGAMREYGVGGGGGTSSLASSDRSTRSFLTGGAKSMDLSTRSDATSNRSAGTGAGAGAGTCATGTETNSKSVRFGTIDVSAFTTRLSDNPSTRSGGPAIELGERCCWETKDIPLDDFEKIRTKNGGRRQGKSLILPQRVREKRLMCNGYTREDMDNAIVRRREEEKAGKMRRSLSYNLRSRLPSVRSAVSLPTDYFTRSDRKLTHVKEMAKNMRRSNSDGDVKGEGGHGGSGNKSDLSQPRRSAPRPTKPKSNARTRTKPKQKKVSSSSARDRDRKTHNGSTKRDRERRRMANSASSREPESLASTSDRARPRPPPAQRTRATAMDYSNRSEASTVVDHHQVNPFSSSPGCDLTYEGRTLRSVLHSRRAMNNSTASSREPQSQSSLQPRAYASDNDTNTSFFPPCQQDRDHRRFPSEEDANHYPAGPGGDCPGAGGGPGAAERRYSSSDNETTLTSAVLRRRGYTDSVYGSDTDNETTLTAAVYRGGWNASNASNEQHDSRYASEDESNYYPANWDDSQHSRRYVSEDEMNYTSVYARKRNKSPQLQETGAATDVAGVGETSDNESPPNHPATSSSSPAVHRQVWRIGGELTSSPADATTTAKYVSEDEIHYGSAFTPVGPSAATTLATSRRSYASDNESGLSLAVIRRQLDAAEAAHDRKYMSEDETNQGCPRASHRDERRSRRDGGGYADETARASRRRAAEPCPRDSRTYTSDEDAAKPSRSCRSPRKDSTHQNNREWNKHGGNRDEEDTSPRPPGASPTLAPAPHTLRRRSTRELADEESEDETNLPGAQEPNWVLELDVGSQSTEQRNRSRLEQDLRSRMEHASQQARRAVQGHDPDALSPPIPTSTPSSNFSASTRSRRARDGTADDDDTNLSSSVRSKPIHPRASNRRRNTHQSRRRTSNASDSEDNNKNKVEEKLQRPLTTAVAPSTKKSKALGLVSSRRLVRLSKADSVRPPQKARTAPIA